MRQVPGEHRIRRGGQGGESTPNHTAARWGRGRRGREGQPRTCECENATEVRSLISSYVTFMDDASEYGQGRDISMPAIRAFVPLPKPYQPWVCLWSPSFRSVPQDDSSSCSGISNERNGTRRCQETLYSPQLSEEGRKTWGQQKNPRRGRGINSHQISFVLVPSFL